MASVSSFLFMSAQQQAIEKTWYNSMIQLASATSGATEIVLPAELKEKLGDEGIAALAQRCSTFSNAHVEVKDDEMTDTTRINVMSPGSLGQSEKAVESSSDTPGSPKKGAKVSRPPNAFILYRQHHHPATVTKNPGVHNNEISKIIGQMWRDEPSSVKDEWKAKSEEVKRQHSKDHPDYQYQPRKPHEKKRRMTKRKAEAMASLANANARTTLTVSPNLPTLNYHNNNTLATFTFDPQSTQLNLFDHMISEHNHNSDNFFDAPAAGATVPAATSVLPTNANNTATTVSAANLHTAQTDLSSFEARLEETLARELENMDRNQAAQEFNDLESQRFTEFLSQMPEHMWGLEFAN